MRCSVQSWRSSTPLPHSICVAKCPLCFSQSHFTLPTRLCHFTLPLNSNTVMVVISPSPASSPFFFHLRKREAELARLHAQRGRPEPSRARPLSPPPARPASYRPPPGDYYSQPPPPKRPRVEQPRTPYSYSAQTPQRTSPMEEMLLFYAFVWYKH